MTPTTRRMVPRDRAAALAALGDARALDQPNQHIYTDGLAFVTVDLARTVPYMGAIAGNVSSRSTFYALALAACDAALAAGHKTGTFDIFDRALLRTIKRDFRISPTATATLTGTNAAWEVTVDLADARQQLLAWLRQ